MKTIFFDTHAYERHAFETANAKFGHELVFVEPRLTEMTAEMAKGFPAVCSFVNDRLNEKTLEILKECGVRLIVLRSAGFNHVDLEAASKLGLLVTRVPEYSPYAVAEHAVTLVLALNRKIHRSYQRVRELNFSLDGLVGFDLHGKTVGIVGTGKIGRAAARIFKGFGCRILAFDLSSHEDLEKEIGVEYVALENLFRESDVISLHVPLNVKTHHLVNADALKMMKPSALIINTGRGGLIDSKALIGALKERRIGGAGLDVYEEEEGIFFKDLSGEGLDDDTLARLLTFPNVIITAHQGFLTNEALANIAETTLESLRDFERGETPKTTVRPP